MNNTEPSVKLRRATNADSAWVYQTKKESLGKYVREVWGWDENWQQKYHSEHFDPTIIDIIILNDIDIGCVIVTDETDYLMLNSIHILPEYQHRGIGTSLIRQLLDRAAAEKRPVRLHVLKINPAAALYKRLNFRIIGETDNHCVMEWAPP